MYKIGFNQGTTLENSSLIQDLEFCTKYGYDYIEIRSLDQLKEYLKENTLNDLKEYFDNHRIKPLSLNALFNINNRSDKMFEEVLAEFQEMVRYAEYLEIEYIVAVASFFDEIEAEKRLTKNEIKDSAVKTLKIFSDILKESNVKVAFEFVGDSICTVNTLGQAITIVEEVNRENIGYCIDAFHFHSMGSRLTDLDKVDMDKVYFVHIDDCEDYPIGFFKDEDRVWPGEGVIDLESFLSSLKANNFNGIFSIELFRPDYYKMDPEKVIKKAYDTTKNVLDKYFV